MICEKWFHTEVKNDVNENELHPLFNSLDDSRNDCFGCSNWIHKNAVDAKSEEVSDDERGND